MELDQRPDGAGIQAHLIETTGQKTVPMTFVKGTRIGGCDDTLKAHAEGNNASTRGGPALYKRPLVIDDDFS